MKLQRLLVVALTAAFLAAVSPATAHAAGSVPAPVNLKAPAPAKVASVSKIIGPDVYDAGAGDNTTLTAVACDFSGTAEHHTLDTAADIDVHKFTVEAGQLYTFDTTGTADTVMQIYDYQGDETFVWSDDKKPGVDVGSHITWTAPEDFDGETFYVIVSAANPVSGVGSYDFTATKATHAVLPSAMGRLAGGTRYGTAQAIAKTAFPAWNWTNPGDGSLHAVNTVIVANGDDAKAADPLASASLAGVYHAPIVFVSTLKVPSETGSVIAEVRAHNGGKVNVIVVGGTGSVPSTIYTALGKLRGTGTIRRISGADRYDVAAKIAAEVSAYWIHNFGHEPDRVFISNGQNTSAFWDALAAGPAMYRWKYPLLLTANTKIPGYTSTVSTKHFKNAAVTEAIVLNGHYVPYAYAVKLGMAPDANPWAFSGDRYDAAYEIAMSEFALYLVPSDRYAVANRLADSLAGGIGAGEMGAAVLYTPATSLSLATDDFLYYRRSGITKTYVLGGTGSVSAGVYNSIAFDVQH